MNHLALIRCTTPAQVEAIATANHTPVDRRSHFASVQLGEVVYFWSAA